jgi:signal transduction histidine kinase/integral membrane sensor domain MASE1/CheY-like chemotaxis protein
MKFVDTRYLFFFLVVVAGYFGAAQLGFSQAFLHSNVSPVWPPTGVGIAAVFLLGYRIAPSLLLGAFLANLVTDVSVATAAGIATGNTLESLAAVYLLRRFVGDHSPFYRASDVVKFVLLAGGLSTTVSATIGTMSLCLSSTASWANFGPLWLTWWLGDFVGAIVIAPLIITWTRNRQDVWTGRRYAEALLLLLLLTMVSGILFGTLVLTQGARYPLGHLTIPLFLWAAFRMGPRGVATAIALVSAIGVAGTRAGVGPFSQYSTNESLLLLQVFLGTVSITSLLLAALVVERKKAEETLADRLHEIETTMEVSPISLFVAQDQAAGRIVGNRAARHFLRIEGDSNTNLSLTAPLKEGPTNFKVMKDGQEVPAEELPIQRAARGLATPQAEFEVVFNDGIVKHELIDALPLYDSKGKPRGAVASFLDITERKRSERRLAAHFAITQILAESPALRDATPRILETVCRTLRWQLGTLWVPEGDQLRLMDVWHEQSTGIDQLVAGSYSGVHTRESGLPGRVWSTLQPIWIADINKSSDFSGSANERESELRSGFAFPIVFNEKFLGVMEFFSKDIREPDDALIAMSISIGSQIGQFMIRKQIEEEREQIITREREARAEAETANRIRDEFLVIVSHELRTPLSSILGWTKLLISGELDQATSARALEAIDRNGKTEAKLIDDLLDASRIITSNLKMIAIPVDLGRIVRAVMDSNIPIALAKGVQLESISSDSPCLVLGDATRLHQIVGNLLSNAIKFTNHGGRVEIRLELQNSRVCLQVIDTGVGIEAEFLPHVFDRFRQADSSRSRRYTGLGLGLTIVQHLVKQHGGSVSAQSQGPGAGSVFTVMLPLAGRVQQNADVQDDARLLSDVSLTGIGVLVVDDDVDSLGFLRIALENSGANVVTANSASAALEVLSNRDGNKQIDVLVSDIGMPGEDGYSLIRKVRGLQRDKLTPIPAIALTGYANDEERVRALREGYQFHMSKPVDTVGLLASIVSLARSNAKGTA